MYHPTLGITALVGMAMLYTPFSQARTHSPPLADRIENCDLVIVEASTGGTAAALLAAQTATQQNLQVRICLTSMTNWLGGQLTSQGVSAIDEPSQFGTDATGTGADKEFISQFITRNARGRQFVDPAKAAALGQADLDTTSQYTWRPHTDEVERLMQPFLQAIPNFSSCWVSTHCFKPSDGDAVLKNLLMPYITRGVVSVFYEAMPKSVTQGAQGAITSVDFIQRTFKGAGDEPYTIPLSEEISDWYAPAESARYTKSRLRITGKVFIDADDFGQVIALSQAHHYLGSQDAGVQDGNPEAVMGFVYPINLMGRFPTVDETAKLTLLAARSTATGFTLYPGKFRFWGNASGSNLPAVFNYRKVSDFPLVTALNWGGLTGHNDAGNDYSDQNFLVPAEKFKQEGQEADWTGGIRTAVLHQAELRAYGFAAWLPQDPGVRDSFRNVTPNFSLHDPANFFGTGTGLSKFPYVRETRRLVGWKGFSVTQDMIGTNSKLLGTFPGPQYTNFDDSVGIGAYPFDVRQTPGGGTIPLHYRYSNHYQIPLRALVSENIPNLLAGGKNLAVSQAANGAFRLHPTEWNTGAGAGAAAIVALTHALSLHQLMASPQYPTLVREIQQNILNAKGRVQWFRGALAPLPTAGATHDPELPPSEPTL